MSIKTVELHVCDVCGYEYTETNPAWMVLQAVNAPENTQAAFDFCTYNCLELVNAPDEEDAEELGEKLDEGEPIEIVNERPQQAPLPERPAMTLADALMMGQTPTFDPTKGDSATRGR